MPRVSSRFNSTVRWIVVGFAIALSVTSVVLFLRGGIAGAAVCVLLALIVYNNVASPAFGTSKFLATLIDALRHHRT